MNREQAEVVYQRTGDARAWDRASEREGWAKDDLLEMANGARASHPKED